MLQQERSQPEVKFDNMSSFGDDVVNLESDSISPFGDVMVKLMIKLDFYDTPCFSDNVVNLG